MTGKNGTVLGKTINIYCKSLIYGQNVSVNITIKRLTCWITYLKFSYLFFHYPLYPCPY